MSYQPSDYESAKKSLRRKLIPGVVILLILAICIFLMMQRGNAPVRRAEPQPQTRSR
jgi:hypothetical protein